MKVQLFLMSVMKTSIKLDIAGFRNLGVTDKNGVDKNKLSE